MCDLRVLWDAARSLGRPSLRRLRLSEREDMAVVAAAQSAPRRGFGADVVEAMRADLDGGLLITGHADFEFGGGRDGASANAGSPGACVYDRHDAYVERDMASGEAWLVRRADAEAAQSAEAWRAAIAEARRSFSAAPAGIAAALASSISDADYTAGVADIVARIRRGDVFQVNFCRIFAADAPPDAADPAGLFARVFAEDFGAFAAFSDFGDRAVLSNSPELFLHVASDGRVRTAPIKGTIARAKEPGVDEERRAILMASEKDRAENMMIVDLMRNDLARACTDEGIRVERACRLETHAAVHHLVSDVTGLLRPGRDALDLFTDAFPPGSVTGAPKSEALRIIAETEREPRGAYCGSSFFLDADGRAVFNVAIRTLEMTDHGAGRRVRAGAGAGVTARSEPAAEERETRAKLAALDAFFARP